MFLVFSLLGLLSTTRYLLYDGFPSLPIMAINHPLRTDILYLAPSLVSL